MNITILQKVEKGDSKKVNPRSNLGEPLEKFLRDYNPREPIEYEIEIPVSRKRVKRDFLIANAFRRVLKKRNLEKRKFPEAYKRITEYYEGLPEYQLDEELGEKRSKRYNSLNWVKKIVRPKELGVWPRFGGTDSSLSIGSLEDTAEGLSKIIEKESNLIPKKTREKILSIGKNGDFIYQNFPIIVTPRGTIRKKSSYKPTKFDIDDGNHRATASALSGSEGIEAYVGKRNSNPIFSLN